MSEWVWVVLAIAVLLAVEPVEKRLDQRQVMAQLAVERAASVVGRREVTRTFTRDGGTAVVVVKSDYIDDDGTGVVKRSILNFSPDHPTYDAARAVKAGDMVTLAKHGQRGATNAADQLRLTVIR